jgi:ribonuclease D
MSENSTPALVDTYESLQALCESLKGADWLALDTEFIREKTYYPRLCLIQIASDRTLACIDPLALDSLAPLYALFDDPAITKVFHAAGQDLEIFYYLRGQLPRPLFDTQLAAALLGHGEQIGYANLVKAVLDVELDKSHTRTDWARRPLQDQQVRYALDDVRYLRELYPRLRSALEKRGRLGWMQSDLERLTDPASYRVEPMDSWKRVKGINRLKRRQLNILKHLAAWREQQAVAGDKPRRWILSDDALLNLATQKPASAEELGHIRQLEPGTVKRHGDTLMGLIKQALSEPESEWPEYKISRKAGAAEEATADLLMAIVRLNAERHELSPGQLTTRGELIRLAQGERELALLRGWRRQLAGDDVLAFLDGRCELADEHDGQAAPRLMKNGAGRE